MTIIEKQCVGCGITYSCFAIGDTLYCTNDCKENHSLLESEEDTSNAKRGVCIEQESFAI